MAPDQQSEVTCPPHGVPELAPMPVIRWHEGGVTGVYVDPDWEPKVGWLHCTCPPPARNVLRRSIEGDA